MTHNTLHKQALQRQPLQSPYYYSINGPTCFLIASWRPTLRRGAVCHRKTFTAVQTLAIYSASKAGMIGTEFGFNENDWLMRCFMCPLRNLKANEQRRLLWAVCASVDARLLGALTFFCSWWY